MLLYYNTLKVLENLQDGFILKSGTNKTCKQLVVKS